MSYNPLLGVGVDSIIQHLGCAPHLEELYLQQVKMTPQQVMNLTSAVQQHGNSTELWSSYLVSFPILSQFVSLFFVYGFFYSALAFRHFPLFVIFIIGKTRDLLWKSNHKLEQIQRIISNSFFSTD